MTVFHVWWRYVVGIGAFVVSGCGSAQVQQVPIEKLDRDMGSAILGSVAQRPFGKLVEDGEGACDRLPFSACGYKVGRYTYYYSAGVLTSKYVEFSSAKDVGPWGLHWDDTSQEIIKKLRPYAGDVAPAGNSTVLFYLVDCSPRLCRLDIEINGNTVKGVQLHYSDET